MMRSGFTGSCVALLVLFLTVGSGLVGAEELRPDRENGAYQIVDGQPVLQFAIRTDRVYPVLRHNRKDTHVLVSLPEDPSRQGWVRYSPAELVPLTADAPALGAGTQLYSRGWAVLYGRLGDARDAALERTLRDLNRNLWTPGYDDAREIMYSSIDAHDGQLRCVYTGLMFPAGKRPGHGPHGESMNAEHTWPQSDFDKREPMRSDLHHLFPTEVEANGIRGSKPFAELGDHEGIAVGSLGARTTEDGFEPPAEHKGNVARALFYFAVQYERDIPADEEATLRAWHRADPPDAAERERNQAIYLLEGSRNHFVDHPELVERISDF